MSVNIRASLASESGTGVATNQASTSKTNGTTTDLTGEDPNMSGNNDVSEGTISYSAERIIGNGSFGVVFQASVVETGEIVAIKKVLQDKRFKNRELQIMRMLVQDPHCNIVGLKHCFYSQVSTSTRRSPIDLLLTVLYGIG